MAEEEIKQLQNKKSSLVSRNRKNEKRDRDAFMRKEQFLKVSLSKARALPKMNFVSSSHFQISKKQSVKKS